MLQIKKFAFNPFQVNTYILYDETGECAIIDAACYSDDEKQILEDFISQKQLKPVLLINTHCHIDHILGNNFVSDTWGLKPLINNKGLEFLESAADYGRTFGFEVDVPVMPDEYLSDAQSLIFGNQNLVVLETPGHADGSICLYHQQDKKVWVGDVIFHGSIGRTDLPTGDYDTLIDSIKSRLLVLPEEVEVFCGHGPTTTIGREKENNPFLK